MAAFLTHPLMSLILPVVISNNGPKQSEGMQFFLSSEENEFNVACREKATLSCYLNNRVSISLSLAAWAAS